MNAIALPALSGLSRRAQLLMVLGGYAAAFAAATAVTAVRIANTQGPDAQASSGMYAFGDALLWLFTFSLAASVPTAAALWFLRGARRFWRVASWVLLGLAATGVAAALLYWAWGGRPVPEPAGTLVTLSPLRLLLAPILSGAFALFALLAPDPAARRRLVLAAVLEAAAGAAALSRLFLLAR